MATRSTSTCARPRLALAGLVVLAAVSSASFVSATVGTCLSGATPTPIDTVCGEGWHCPLYVASDSATYPVFCAPTNECMFDRLTTKTCDPQGTYEPRLCKAGYYCPNAVDELKCPSGHVCDVGTFTPLKCASMTICPEGSSTTFDYSSLVATAITDICLLIIWYLAMKGRRLHWANRDSTYQEMDVGASVNQSLYTKGAIYNQLPAHSKVLCKGFKRAQKTLPVMHLGFQELSLTIPVKGKKGLTILKGVTGSVEPTKVTAIMGPSGAGKTTFLNTMLGAVDSTWQRGGTLQINGVDEPLGRFRKIIGYVPQEDVMHRDLSVYDNIRHSALTRLPSEWTDKQREDHINATISAMQLKHVQDTRVGDEVVRGVSGGQRKRANIGLEVAAAPSLLLLDEPTSGLDSTAALEICQVLKDLARVSGLTVAMVIHQPRVEIWNQLDELLLLAPGGLTVYQGPQRLAVKYFQQRFDVHFAAHENPADSLMDCIAQQADEFVSAWKEGGKELVQQLRDSSKTEADLLNEAPIEVPDEEEEGFSEQHLIAQEVAQGRYGVGAIPLDIIPGTSPSSADKVTETVIHISPRKDTLDNMKHPLRGYKSGACPPAFEKTATGGPLRVTAGFWTQVWLTLVRNLWKQVANLPTLYLEMGLGLLAGGIMGGLVTIKFRAVLSAPYTLLSSAPLDSLIANFMQNVGLAIALAAVSAGVAVFSEERVISHREVSAGANHLAYYLGTNLAQFPRIFLDAIHFSWLFHMIAQPLISFPKFMAIAFLLYCSIYGLAFIVSMVVSRKNAALLGVVVCLFATTMTAKGGFPEIIQYLSASRWATEAMFSEQTEPFRGTMQVANAAYRFGYTLDRFPTDLGLMFVIGIFYRLIAYALMRWVDRKILASS